MAAPPRKNKFISLTKVWAKYLIRKAYEVFDPLARKMRVPTYAVIGLIVLLIVGLFAAAGAVLNRPTVPLAVSITPFHIIQVNSGQVSEMDVTTYADLQSKLQTMAFAPVLQMTVPQLPSPNFFDVGMKEEVGTYSEILKVPGQITPHLSFVTVFSNGVWYSTNAWQGTNQELEYLVSEFYPNDAPDQLYIRHVQGIEKLKQERDWTVQGMNLNRYIAALSDHVRWYVDKKDIQTYKADFATWH